jgi:hypothetical protein
MSAADKYAEIISAARRAGYVVTVSLDDDGSGLLDMEHPDHDRRDILDDEKDGTLFYIQINSGHRDVARHYNHHTDVDQLTSVAAILTALTAVTA